MATWEGEVVEGSFKAEGVLTAVPHVYIHPDGGTRLFTAEARATLGVAFDTPRMGIAHAIATKLDEALVGLHEDDGGRKLLAEARAEDRPLGTMIPLLLGLWVPPHEGHSDAARDDADGYHLHSGLATDLPGHGSGLFPMVFGTTIMLSECKAVGLIQGAAELDMSDDTLPGGGPGREVMEATANAIRAGTIGVHTLDQVVTLCACDAGGAVVLSAPLRDRPNGEGLEVGDYRLIGDGEEMARELVEGEGWANEYVKVAYPMFNDYPETLGKNGA